VAERRARLGHNHLLDQPRSATTPVDVAEALVVLHATDPATIYLSIGARAPDASTEGIDRVLFEDRSLFRTLAMRRTLFVVTPATAALVEGSSSGPVATLERRKLEGWLADSGIDDPARWLADLADEVLAALGEPDAGEGRTARELSAAIPRLATRVMTGRGSKHPVEMTVTSRVLGVMAVEGHLIRGRPTGGWTGRQYRWHRRDRWWPDAADRAGSGPDGVDAEAWAAAGLVDRYLQTFGPCIEDDVVWWTGWTKGKTRAALADLRGRGRVVDVDLIDDAGPGDRVAGLASVDAEESPGPGPAEPWAALLPALDPTPMGWKVRDWYLGHHRPALFDRNGNIGPTVWVDGRIVGGWAQRPDGEVVVELLEDVGADHRRLIDERAAGVQRFVGDVTVKPSFPTPLQRELATP
jgi:hypothetical protein